MPVRALATPTPATTTRPRDGELSSSSFTRLPGVAEPSHFEAASDVRRVLPQPTTAPVPVNLPWPMTPKVYEPKVALGALQLSCVTYGSPEEMKAKLLASGFKTVDVIVDEKTSTELVVASRDDGIFVAFRGTQEGNDWLTDFNGGAGFNTRDRFGGKVHVGFLDAYESIRPDLDAVLARLQREQKRPLFFTGHSLGGALAELAAETALEKGYDVSSVYTFGQPRVGDRQWAKRYEEIGLGERTFRVVNQEDPVTQMPSFIGNELVNNIGRWFNGEETNQFTHVGNQVHFDKNGDRTINPDQEALDAASSNKPWLETFDFHRLAGYLKAVQADAENVLGR